MSTPQKIRVDYSDEDVRKRVSRWLTSRHFPAFRLLNVEVCHGLVTLSGAVDSYYEKQVAITSCQRVAGVLSLIDQVEVSDRDSVSSRMDRHATVAHD